FAFTWNNVSAGTYTLTATATDNSGSTGTSAAVSVTVSAAPTGGPNLALLKPVTASSIENGTTPAAAAVDGNGGTRWSSAFSDPQWIYVDLGNRYDIGQVKLTWEGAYGRNYLLQVSDDAAQWTSVKTVTGNTSLVNDHTGLTATGRYVRVYGTERATPYGYSLFELEVYGKKPEAYCGSAPNGDYSYKASASGSNITFTFHPQGATAGGNLAIIYIREGASGGYPGYLMTKNEAGDFTFTKSIAPGTPTSIYFTYQVGPNGPERNTAATPHSYTAGASCSGTGSNGAPVVQITSPASGSTFTAPASITLTADATDADGTIAGVSFYNGNELLGTVTASPYTFHWNNVPAGAYTVTAKAEDNGGLITTSEAVNLTVTGGGSAGAYCGTAANGDYSYKVTTSGDKVTFTFHPLAPIAGSQMAIVYPKPAAQAGPPPGYGMTREANGDFTFTISGQTAGTTLSFYFTYAVPAGGERNSSASPHTYTTGTNCAGADPAVTLSGPGNTTVASDANGCSAVVANLDPVITPATANVEVRYTMSGATEGSGTGTVSGKTFQKGTTTVTYSLETDASKTVSFTVTVEDGTAPVPAAATLPVLKGDCAVTVSEKPTAVDNCGASIEGTTTDPLQYTGQGAYRITWTFTDASGNVTTQEQEVVVKDETAPVLSVPQGGLLCFQTGAYTLAPLTATDNCGIAQVSYAVTGATQRSGSGADASGTFQPGESRITWTVTDVHGNSSTGTTTVTVNPEIQLVIGDARALPGGVDPNTVYLGYAPAGSLQLKGAASGGSGAFTYSWSDGAMGASRTVKASVPGTVTYTLVASDGYCTAQASKTITTRDVSCGNGKVLVCQVPPGNTANPKTQCIAASAVSTHLSKGAYLGACGVNPALTVVRPKEQETAVPAGSLTVTALPNPTAAAFRVTIRGGTQERSVVRVLDPAGRVVETRNGISGQILELGAAYRPGVYFLEVTQGGQRQVVRLVKQ
ncbi:MAG TPA: discoidin domain-containing protein, partial [Chitinophagaceae bacterium]|nr:discoidin domain-containing protein [Chitinophagaceae bacterium]